MTSILSAVLAVILRVGLQIFDRKILNKNPTIFSEIMQMNSIYPFLFSILFILVLGQVQNLLQYIFSWWIITQGVILAAASWSISLGLKNMNLRYVVVVQKIVDLLIPCILLVLSSTQTISWRVFASIPFYTFQVIRIVKSNYELENVMTFKLARYCCLLCLARSVSLF